MAATLSVSPQGVDYNYTGTINRTNGGVETFNLMGAKSRATDADSTIRVDADEFTAEITVRTTDFCSSIVHMTTNPSANLAPIAGRNSPWTQGICQSANSTYFYGWDMLAADRDGYIAKHPTFIYTIDGQVEVQLAQGANADAASTYATQLAPKRVDRVEITNIPCTSGFTWEYIVEDNEGRITTEAGSLDAPFDAGSGSGDGDYCAEDYPGEACTALNNQTSTSAIFAAGQTCAAAFPGSQVLDDFTCTGDGIFTSCGACLVDVSTATRSVEPQSLAVEAFYNVTLLK